jgi:hypothetical protein
MRRFALACFLLAACGDDGEQPPVRELSAAGTCPDGYQTVKGHPVIQRKCVQAQGVPLFCLRAGSLLSPLISCVQKESTGAQYQTVNAYPTPTGWTACDDASVSSLRFCAP